MFTRGPLLISILKFFNFSSARFSLCMILSNRGRDPTLKWHNGVPHFIHKWAGGGGKYKVRQIYPPLVGGFEMDQVALNTSEAVCLIYRAHGLDSIF